MRAGSPGDGCVTPGTTAGLIVFEWIEWLYRSYWIIPLRLEFSLTFQVLFQQLPSCPVLYFLRCGAFDPTKSFPRHRWILPFRDVLIQRMMTMDTCPGNQDLLTSHYLYRPTVFFSHTRKDMVVPLDYKYYNTERLFQSNFINKVCFYDEPQYQLNIPGNERKNSATLRSPHSRLHTSRIDEHRSAPSNKANTEGILWSEIGHCPS